MFVDRRELLAFYDDPTVAERGIHAAAVNAVAGEEFGMALLLSYLNSSGVDATHLPGPCTTGRRSGHRLDGWVQTPQVLYQVEIKNWSSHSFGGRALSLAAPDDKLRAYRMQVWNEYWTGTSFADAAAQKVLEPMRAPVGNVEVEPLIVFWPAMHPNGEPEPLFTVPLEAGDFARVTVFSMSAYLRSMSVDKLELSLPKTCARMGILSRIFMP